MKLIHQLPALFLFVLIVTGSCTKEETIQPIKISTVSGLVQKGPFNVGTDVVLFELNENLVQTGKSFNAVIESENGYFEFKNIELISPYVLLKADGFYYNEVKGRNSDAKLTLYALSDVSEKSQLNVNVLSHLEKPRIEKLILEGINFENAKNQAQKEILNIFEVSEETISNSELLDITNNSILLAVSSILQGFRNVEYLSEFLTKVGTDIKGDGNLDDSSLQTALASHASYLNSEKINDHLSHKYSEAGTQINFPDCKTHIQNFLNNTTFNKSEIIVYPENSDKGKNILHKDLFTCSSYYSSTKYSMCVQSLEGIDIKIEIQLISGSLSGAWGYNADKINWKVSDYNWETKHQVFEVMDTSKEADLNIVFFEPGSKIKVTIHEGSNVITKEISIQ